MITGTEFLNYVIVGYLYKTLIEVILLPVTYRVIAVVKEREPALPALSGLVAARNSMRNSSNSPAMMLARI